MIGSLTPPAERVESRGMSTDEQERHLGKVVLAIKEKQEERARLRSRVRTFITGFEEATALYNRENRNNEALKQLLIRLEQEEAPITTFRTLIETELDLACLQRTLGLSLNDD